MSNENSIDRGERGPKGDHGQPGHVGETGSTGETGIIGKTGRSFNRTQVVTGFLIILSIFGLLGYRSEINAQAIRDETHLEAGKAYVLCVTSNQNNERINDVFESLIAVEMRNPLQKTSPITVARRIEIYKAARLDPVPCGDKP